MSYESTYFPTFPNGFKRLNGFSMAMIYFSSHHLVVLFLLLRSESLSFDGWSFHMIYVKGKTMWFTWVPHLKLSTKHSQMHTPQIQKRGSQSMHTGKKFYASRCETLSVIYRDSENRTVISRFTTSGCILFTQQALLHGFYDSDRYICLTDRKITSVDSYHELEICYRLAYLKCHHLNCINWTVTVRMTTIKETVHYYFIMVQWTKFHH